MEARNSHGHFVCKRQITGYLILTTQGEMQGKRQKVQGSRKRHKTQDLNLLFSPVDFAAIAALICVDRK